MADTTLATTIVSVFDTSFRINMIKRSTPIEGGEKITYCIYVNPHNSSDKLVKEYTSENVCRTWYKKLVSKMMDLNPVDLETIE